MTRKTIFWKLAYLLISAGIFLIDQSTKAWAVRRLRLGGEISLIEGFLNLSYAHNTGIAFSMLDDYGEPGRWGLAFGGLIAAVLVIYFFWRTPRTDDRMLGGLALMLGGIAGNITDRIRLGFVIDFIDVQFGSWHYPTFNVADMAIVIGALLLMVDIFLNKRKGKETVATSTASE